MENAVLGQNVCQDGARAQKRPSKACPLTLCSSVSALLSNSQPSRLETHRCIKLQMKSAFLASNHLSVIPSCMSKPSTRELLDCFISKL